MKLTPFKLERYFARHEFSAPYLLCSSDCESMTLRDLLALDPGAAEKFQSLWLGYTESSGHPDLRRAISTIYKKVTADQILVHAGAEEAIFNFMNVVLGPGDHVIVHAPYYQSLGEVALGIGAEVSEWRGDPGRQWELDMDVLRGLLTERTRLVVVNFPHNPTGFLPVPDFVRELSTLSERQGFRIFSDEVYRGLELDPSHRLPALADMNERAVSLGVMSKTYGLAGLRIGWIATRDHGLLSRLAAFKDYTTICNSAPSEFLATLALRNAGAIVERNLNIIRENLDGLDAFFQSHADLFDWYRPKAGSVFREASMGKRSTRFAWVSAAGACPRPSRASRRTCRAPLAAIKGITRSCLKKECGYL
ncbi:MAG: aminotransferase class I/II-fold pyridoxal phosphate-dependent enzyme [Desulfosarcinaceae bacterium]